METPPNVDPKLNNRYPNGFGFSSSNKKVPRLG
jgi:hypothetical protein